MSAPRWLVAQGAPDHLFAEQPDDPADEENRRGPDRGRDPDGARLAFLGLSLQLRQSRILFVRSPF